jgi:hypothetical protein
MVRVGVRGKVQSAVRGMKRAELVEDPAERFELARSSTVELIAADALFRAGCEAAEESLEQSLVRLEALPGVTRHAESLESFRKVQAALRAKLEYDALVRLFTWLERHIESRTPRELLVSRWSCWAGVAALPLAVAWWALSPRNLALARQVSASSICQHTPEPPLGKPALYRVVDGREAEQRFAVCTNLERHPWVQVDLGGLHRIDRVVIYPRTDCCYGELELPLTLQVSADGKHFESVGASATPATAEFPWRFALRGSRARYVRVTSESAEARHVVLGEIEVYGR